MTAHPGIVLGAARFFHDPRGSIRGVLAAQPGESRLLAYAMIAAAILLAGRLAQTVQMGVGQQDLVARFMEQTVSLMFFLPLLYYGLAAAGTLISRLFGGTGSWREGRIAFFWSALVAAPVLVFSMLAPGAISDMPQLVRIVLGQAGSVFFAWALALCFTEAFGFSRVWPALATISSPVVLIFIVRWVALP